MLIFISFTTTTATYTMYLPYCAIIMSSSLRDVIVQIFPRHLSLMLEPPTPHWIRIQFREAARQDGFVYVYT